MSVIIAVGLVVRYLTARGRRQAAATLMLVICPLVLTLCCLFFDLATPGSPRSTHLYLLALAAATPLLLGDENDALCYASIAGNLILFALLASTDIGIRTRYALPASTQGVCSLLNAIGAVLALMTAVILSVMRPAERADLLPGLRRAVERQEFVLYLQAIVDAERRPIGAEALLRWQHPRLGTLNPGEFIELAETSGLIQVIGQWAIEEACRILARWRQHEHLRGLTLAVNFSALQLSQPDFAAQVLAALRNSEAPPQLLVLELTESALVSDIAHAQRIISELNLHGVRFALDDFGTGHASMSALLDLPVARLKIDQSFVRALPTSPRAAAIVEALIALGHTLDRPVVAEGIETAQDLENLRAMGCRQFQGFLFSPPVPLADFESQVALVNPLAAV